MTSELTGTKKVATAVSLSGIVGIGALFAIFDDRYAMASEVNSLVELIRDDRIERLEYQIEEVERRWARIMMIPASERTDWEKQDLVDLEAQKDRLLRKLDRMNDSL